MQRTIDIALMRPHSPTQHAMITHPGSVVAFCGRRYGKTDAYVQRLFYHMQQKPGLYWWVGLTWRSASMKRAWREVTDVARSVLLASGLDPDRYINRSAYEVRIPGLGEIWFRTSENPSSLAGEGIRGAVVDEFSLMSETVWTEYLEGTLLDHGGWVAFSGVPKGNNWAANIWRKAGNREGWLQIHATTYDNPFIDRENIDRIRYDSNTSERYFRQEYLAEIIEDAGGVFRGVRDMATATLRDYGGKDNTIVAGLDWALSYDYTVLIVMDAGKREVIHVDRFNGVDYSIQRERIIAACKRFEVIALVAEENAMGKPNNDELRKRGVPVRDFTTTHASKSEIIESLAAAFENRNIRIPNHDELITELQSYEVQRTASGQVTYSAPEGMHDDMVMALALANFAASTGQRRRATAKEY